MKLRLKLKQDLLRFNESKALCKGKTIHLGSSNFVEGSTIRDNELHEFLKKKGVDAISVGLEGADININLEKKEWGIKKKYDTVLAPEILEHLQNPTQFIKNSCKLLKKNGRFIISTPNAASLIYIFNPNWCVNYDRKFDADNCHISAFTTGMLKYLLEREGIKNVRFKFLNGNMHNPILYFIGRYIPRLRGTILIWGEKE